MFKNGGIVLEFFEGEKFINKKTEMKRLKNIEECNNENIDIGIELDRNISKNDKFFCVANNI